MIQLEYMPVVIEAHRRDLRRLYEPIPPELRRPSRRERLAAHIVSLGCWIADTCREVPEQPATLAPGHETAI